MLTQAKTVRQAWQQSYAEDLNGLSDTLNRAEKRRDLEIEFSDAVAFAWRDAMYRADRSAA